MTGTKISAFLNFLNDFDASMPCTLVVPGRGMVHPPKYFRKEILEGAFFYKDENFYSDSNLPRTRLYFMDKAQSRS